MKASKNCLALIEEFEGFSEKPYYCPSKVPTIGFGSTTYEDGTSVKMTDKPITRGRAEQLMRNRLVEYENAVSRYVSVALNQNQFDALVSFAYNCGNKNLKNSSLLKWLNAGNYARAANCFRQWVYGNGKKLPGLVRRREAEKALFLKA